MVRNIDSPILCDSDGYMFEYDPSAIVASHKLKIKIFEMYNVENFFKIDQIPV